MWVIWPSTHEVHITIKIQYTKNDPSKKQRKTILKKIQKKKNKKIKKHVGKAKAKFSTNSILKKVNSTKIILKKNTCGEILYQNKNHMGGIL